MPALSQRARLRISKRVAIGLHYLQKQGVLTFSIVGGSRQPARVDPVKLLIQKGYLMVTTTAKPTAPDSKAKTRAKRPSIVSSKPVSKASPRPRVKAIAKTQSEPSTATTRVTHPVATLKQVATQSRRKVSTVVHMTRDASFKLIDSQRAIWLAGLGALARVTTSTGTQGEKAFEALVKAGEQLEQQARHAIDDNAERLKLRIDDASKAVDERIETVSDAFDTRVKQALSRLGYPKAGKTAAKKPGGKNTVAPA